MLTPQPQHSVLSSAQPSNALTLNQLLPSRFPPVLNSPAIVNPIDLNTLVKLTGAQLVGPSKPNTTPLAVVTTAPAIKKEVSVAPAVVTATGSVQPSAAMTSLQSAMVANALLVSAASATQATSQAPKPLQSVGTVSAAQANPQAATLASALLAATPQNPMAGAQMPVQLITPQQLQQLILQATLQQQLQQQLAQQLQQVAAADPKTAAATLKPAPQQSTSVANIAPSVAGSQSQAATTVTPISMPTIGLNQLLQPMTDLSAAVSPAAVQLAPAGLQHTLATAQLNQVMVPQVLKTLGQLPTLLQQPTLTVPVMVSMPSVLPPPSAAAAPSGSESVPIAKKE